METKNTLAQWIDGQSDFPEDIQAREIYENIKHYSAQLEAPTFEKVKVFKTIKNTRASKTQTRPSIKSYAFKIAAILVLAAGLLVFLKAITKAEFTTKVAQSQTIQLPDQSNVLLQPGSSLSYNDYFWFLNREVKLEGEAFFEVAKGETFTVKTANGEVKVLGTKFNVKTFHDELQVMCYEGRVEVSQNNLSDVITPNEFIVLSGGEISKETLQLKELPSKSGYFQIINSNFDILIKDVERYYGVDINSKQIETNKSFTGQLPKNDVKKALDIISKTYQVRYNTINENNFIFVGDEGY
ncbi:FecR family protein [Mesohalobacter halotolerans]|uniref:FecR family protein n=1 Tax=Mesohalobacter halotolerans TaxID=1883405 RepID=A0A4U5TS85_9FLAO|nr:FecR family protein [Mesohalobacter halotolerans]MBS3737430.1 FecR family protein [Psychroflexus sp.]TKS56882.1 FecR family protein [Mesohalobacter halotolerans]